MNSKTRSHKLLRWLALSTQVLAVGGLISFSARAQVQNQQQASQDKPADVVTIAEAAPAGAATVSAKPIPEPTLPPFAGGTWTGFYVGGHIGYGWGRANTSFTPLPTAVAFINLAPTTLRPDPKGFNAGGQVGYNHQWGSFVAGLEADISWSRMDGTATMVGFTQNTGAAWNGTLTAHQDTTWFGTLRPRAGAAFGRVLVYGTAGLAYGHVNYSANADFRPQGTIQYPASFGKTKKGWTAGGGAEIAVSKHVSVKAEYLYYDLGNESITANPVPANPPFQVAYTWQTKAHTFNAGVNFHF
ncbi:MAG TPA: outer membrane protein [Pyrinomonadaceae bacterium]|nr:outer membrane protein [Pyrinomonadaceae bacterium]